MATATKKKATKKASKKKTTVSTAGRIAPPSPPKGAKPGADQYPQQRVDPKKLSTEDARKRCDATYKAEDLVEKTQAALARASAAKRKAKATHDTAVQARDTLLYEQRYGSGPLVDIMEGKGKR